jgi:hypothetical protein
VISLDLIRPTGLKLVKGGAERILVAAFCGNSRPPELADYQRRVFAHFGIPLNHILVDFARFTHGAVIDYFLTKIGALYDYLVLFGGIHRVKELGSREDALLSGSPAR